MKETQGAPLSKPPEVLSIVLKDDGAIPNSRFPVLIYRNAVKLEVSNPASTFEKIFSAHGWDGSWRDGVYTYHHYHSTAHEVLGVFSGAATLQLGGEHGVKHRVMAGDVVILPAGVAHKNLGASSDFGVVGAYPPGEEWDMNYGRPKERPEADEKISRVPIPAQDPVYGKDGPLLREWSEALRMAKGEHDPAR